MKYHQFKFEVYRMGRPSVSPMLTRCGYFLEGAWVKEDILTVHPDDRCGNCMRTKKVRQMQRERTTVIS